MVANGSEVSPLRRCKALLSSGETMVFSVKGMPRPVNKERADAHGPQFSPVYSVTGYLLTICLNSYGSTLPDALLLAPGLPAEVVAFALLAAGGGWSEKDTLPSGPTMR